MYTWVLSLVGGLVSTIVLVALVVIVKIVYILTLLLPYRSRTKSSANMRRTPSDSTRSCYSAHPRCSPCLPLPLPLPLL